MVVKYVCCHILLQINTTVDSLQMASYNYNANHLYYVDIIYILNETVNDLAMQW